MTDSTAVESYCTIGVHSTRKLPYVNRHLGLGRLLQQSTLGTKSLHVDERILANDLRSIRLTFRAPARLGRSR